MKPRALVIPIRRPGVPDPRVIPFLDSLANLLAAAVLRDLHERAPRPVGVKAHRPRPLLRLVV